MTTKHCTKCGELKPLSKFYQSKRNGKKGVHAQCKLCFSSQIKDYKKTKEGLITKIYSSQRSNSRFRGHNPPEYSSNELKEFLLDLKKFHLLYDKWVISGFNKMKIPSVDRINDSIGYSLSNIQLMTWEQNKNKGDKNRNHKLNTKNSKPVIQYSKNGDMLREFPSQMEAMRHTGICVVGICKCVNGKIKTSGGFVWEFK